MVGIFWIVAIVACVAALPAEVDVQPNVIVRYLNVEDRISRHGYYSESHTVRTSDGYILEMNRIPFGHHENKDDAPNPKPVVFLMHGLMSSALCFITNGPRLAIAYNLVDAGYDVWMGNARGVINSRNHVRLNPDNPDDIPEFFDYSFEDIGMKDLPAMIDYVLAYTGRSQLHYIGHSQGGTAFLVMASMLPEYNNKIKSTHLLAGVGYQNHFPNRAVSKAADVTNAIHFLLVRRGVNEIFGPDANLNMRSDFRTECGSGLKAACRFLDVLDLLEQITKYLEMMGGISVKQIAHYGQNVKDEKFRRWDFNSALSNFLRYGSITPPEFDLSKITADVTMHYTISDHLLDERDVLEMAATIPNTKVRKVARDSFSHTDFVAADDAKVLVTDYIIEQLNKHDML